MIFILAQKYDPVVIYNFLQILGGNPAATNIIDANLAAGEGGNDVFCGRYFSNVAAGGKTDVTVCCKY